MVRNRIALYADIPIEAPSRTIIHLIEGLDQGDPSKMSSRCPATWWHCALQEVLDVLRRPRPRRRVFRRSRARCRRASHGFGEMHAARAEALLKPFTARVIEAVETTNPATSLKWTTNARTSEVANLSEITTSKTLVNELQHGSRPWQPSAHLLCDRRRLRARRHPLAEDLLQSRNRAPAIDPVRHTRPASPSACSPLNSHPLSQVVMKSNQRLRVIQADLPDSSSIWRSR